MSSALGSQLQWNTSTGIQTKYANIATVQGGVPAEYASTGTTQVALQTTSTAILSYTPTASGLFLVVVSCAHTAATVAGTCVATCTDVGTNATTTETVTLTSAAPGVHQTVIFCFSAKTSVAIAITGTAATNNDILANAAIFAL